MADRPLRYRPSFLSNAFQDSNSISTAAPKPTAFEPFFLIGRHAQPAYLQTLLLARSEPEVLPARLHAHRAIHIWENYYVLVPSNKKDDIVDGSVYYPQTPWQAEKLESLAQGHMLIDNVPLQIWRGWRRKEVWGRTIVYSRDMVSLRQEAEEMREMIKERRREMEDRKGEAWERMIKVCRDKVYDRVWAWVTGVHDGDEGASMDWDWDEKEVEYDLVIEDADEEVEKDKDESAKEET